ncbi:MAG TPA: thymidine phosphorylase [Clostridia bacterium]|nr:thymidine phosphorylase [Clostridia bacterium]
MLITEIIEKKAEGKSLTTDEIRFVIRGYTENSIPDYQMAAFLMAVKIRGMNAEETSDLTLAMLDSGEKIDLYELPGVKVDKHSTGGVGDTTTLVVVPIVAACGSTVVKMSGRGLGHTGGTIDKLETLPGYCAEQTETQMKSIAARTGAVIVSQSKNLVPADKMIYALRDVTGTVGSIPLIASSIMSKKIAAGADAIVLDVKTGSGALLPEYIKAKELAVLMVEIGKTLGRKIVALLTDMDQPLGKAIGNVLEVREAIQLLSGEIPADDPLYTVSIELASQMLMLSANIDRDAALKRCSYALTSGAALKKFQEILTAEGAEPVYLSVSGMEPLCRVKKQIVLVAQKSGFIEKIHTEQLGRAAQLLGAGRIVKTDEIDPAVGIIMEKRLGDAVSKGDVLCTMYVNREDRTEEAKQMILDHIVIGDTNPEQIELIREVIS